MILKTLLSFPQISNLYYYFYSTDLLFLTICDVAGMVAGGSGVSAMIPILHRMLNEKSETPKCSLLSTNKTEKDIILRDELTKMASKFRHRLRVWYTVDQPIAKDWKYGVGMVGSELLRDWMPKPEASVLSKSTFISIGSFHLLYYQVLFFCSLTLWTQSHG